MADRHLTYGVAIPCLFWFRPCKAMPNQGLKKRMQSHAVLEGSELSSILCIRHLFCRCFGFLVLSQAAAPLQAT
jgi:hypothetical protein